MLHSNNKLLYCIRMNMMFYLQKLNHFPIHKTTELANHIFFHFCIQRGSVNETLKLTSW